MNSIVFIDTEVSEIDKRISDIGALKTDGSNFHSGNIYDFQNFISDAKYFCGHNIIKHDLDFIKKETGKDICDLMYVIDTLFLSPLIFPEKPYHHLIKDDKLISEELNNPVADSIRCKELLHAEIDKFHTLSDILKSIYYFLLKNQPGYSGFFKYIEFQPKKNTLDQLVKEYFKGIICENLEIRILAEKNPIELAYALSVITTTKRDSIIPQWVVKSYPRVTGILYLLRNNPCIGGCSYCNEVLDPKKSLKKYFGYDKFRIFNGESLQENAVIAAIKNKSILSVFPTGGGKSLTFQLPALIAGESTRGLTVVISPLQSLMKDQVDGLEEKNITEAVAISGLLDPIERKEALDRIEEGTVSLLYLAPESLRSHTIEQKLLGRNIVRFVIDEAHCFSTWGHDFRVDYLYIGEFIKNIQKKKNLETPIPVSCFTATAKKAVIEDILKYFKEQLNEDLELFATTETRRNLKYIVIPATDDNDKFLKLRNLIDNKDCPSIVYVSRTKKAIELSKKLKDSGIDALPFHGKMEREEKVANQDAFMNGSVNTIVATSAFGMGVNKANVGRIVHYDISDSLENYVQEAGRAGRDESINADCYVLYNENDLLKHFILLNQTKVDLKEIQDIWKAIKSLHRTRDKISNSALEIARAAGWNEYVAEMETRVLTAISALEMAGYIKRGQNNPRIFASSIQVNTAQEAIDRIKESNLFNEKQREYAVRIMRSLISTRSRKRSSDEIAESRVDFIAENLGIVRDEVIAVINLLREEKILADNNDLTAFLYPTDSVKSSKASLIGHSNTEKFLLKEFFEVNDEVENGIKTLNEKALNEGIKECTVEKLRTIVNFWLIKRWFKNAGQRGGGTILHLKRIIDSEFLAEKIRIRHQLANYILDYLFRKSEKAESRSDNSSVTVTFSVLEIKQSFLNQNNLFKEDVSNEDVEDALLFLSRIGAIKIDGGFLVVYNKLAIERLEKNNKVQYKIDDYRQLADFYKNKVEQIHIVGEYAKRMLSNYSDALKMVDDYFQLNYDSFISKYFPGSRKEEISMSITPSKFQEVFFSLSPSQQSILRDNQSSILVVAAGPGSGKTKLLVHKMAAIILMEQVKSESLLMLTFSRAAAVEFKSRLLNLLGNRTNFIEIKTFHSYCFDILGLVGNIEKSDEIIEKALAKISNNEVEPCRITKEVIVVDEAQDMSESEYRLICKLLEFNETAKLIAVGDDDQNIYEFRGSSSKFLWSLLKNPGAKKYELVDNFRSTPSIVEFANSFSTIIRNRLKELPLISMRKDEGSVYLKKYNGSNIIVPAVTHILKTPLSGTTSILTRTNDEASFVYGMLLNRGGKVRLNTNDDDIFSYNVKEIRFFINSISEDNSLVTIPDEIWAEAKDALKKSFKRSTVLDSCLGLINDFELTNNRKKYLSDLTTFFRESKINHRKDEDSSIITVSTIHKAKGREYDNVFLLLKDYKTDNEENKRALFVGITRAKTNLFIHYTGTLFDNVQCRSAVRESDNSEYSEPEFISLRLGHDDVNLGYFQYIQRNIRLLRAGDDMGFTDEGCVGENGKFYLKYSAKFREKLAYFINKAYTIVSAKVFLSLYWKPKDQDDEFLIILPQLFLRKIET
ncbi:MAG: RecQ family ATP-dependent DNA helicase [Bacteroidales bacterium]